MLSDQKRAVALDRLRTRLHAAGPIGLPLPQIMDWAEQETPIPRDQVVALLDRGSDAAGDDRLFVEYEPGCLGDGLPVGTVFADIRVALPTAAEVVELVRAAQTAGQREADIVEHMTARYLPEVVDQMTVRGWLADADCDGVLVDRIPPGGTTGRWYAAEHAPDLPVPLGSLRLPVPLIVYADWLHVCTGQYLRRPGATGGTPTTDHLVVEDHGTDGRSAVFYDRPVDY